MKKLTKFLYLMAVLVLLVAAITITAAADETDGIDVTNFVYTQHSDGLYITGYEGDLPEILTFPSEINGKEVVGIAEFNVDGAGVKEINIPDSITAITYGALAYDWDNLEIVNIGAGMLQLKSYHFSFCKNLKAVNISESNTYLCSIDGVVYDKQKTALVFLPEGKTSVTTIPNTVSDLSALAFNISENIALEANNPNFVMENNVVYNYAKTRIIHCNPVYSGEYVAPDTVTSVASTAFAGCKDLTAMTMPEGVTEIAYMQFANCTGLQSLTIPSTVEAIDVLAFSGCGSIPTVNVASIESWCNMRHDSIIKGYDLYVDGVKQTTLNIPATISVIDSKTFAYCYATGVVFPSNPLTIYYRAFANSGLTSVTVPSNVVYLSDRVFADCANLETVNMQSNCDPEFLFEGCPVKNLTFSDTRGSIGDYLFANSDIQSSYTIPANVTVIGYSSFYNCDDLISVNVPGTVSMIAPRAFAHCNSLQSINVTDSAYSYYSTGDNGELLGCGGYELIQVPGGLSGKYTVPESVYEIAYFAFEGCSKLTSVTIPDHVYAIGGQAFSGTKLKHINFPESMTVLSDLMFGWGSPLESLYLPAGLEEIKEYVFMDTPKLKDVYFGGTKEQWEAVIISDWGNYCLENATIHYNAQPLSQAGWVKDGDKYYYVNDDGNYAKGWKVVNNTWYYFDNTGVMQTGWLKSGNTWYYLNSSGAMAIGWAKVGNTWYYFASSGAMATGWLQLGNAWYYLNSSGAMVTDYAIADGKLCKFNASGVWQGYVTGWCKQGNSWYYGGAGSNATTGWKSIGGVYYYFNGNGVMQTGWLKSGNTWYYLNSSGAMATGWAKVGNTWYYFASSGAMKTGWLKLGNTWYYFGSSGAMATGNVRIGAKTYRFNASGACLNP